MKYEITVDFRGVLGTLCYQAKSRVGVALLVEALLMTHKCESITVCPVKEGTE